MSLVNVRIEKLFGDLDHEIALRLEEGLTIVHGPNGVGKTTLLRMIDSLFRRNFRLLARTPFEKATFAFSNGLALAVSRERHKDAQGWQLTFAQLRSRGRTSKPFIWRGIDPRAHVPYSVLDDFLPNLERVGARLFLDTTVGDTLRVHEVLDRYGSVLPEPIRSAFEVEEPPAWLIELLTSTPTAYIRAQRLSTTEARPGGSAREAREEPTVMVFSRDVVRRISETLARYAEFSQNLDSTFPRRVLDLKEADNQSLINDRYEQQSRRRQQYVAVGLLDGSEVFALPDRNFEEGELRVLTTYLGDVDRKLDQLDDFASKVALFQEIVNSKFRRKALTISRQEGFAVTDTSGNDLQLTDLSSGEQQELVLAYELLFRHPSGTLVLIDEPELSLHISWQMAFIQDLLSVAQLTGLQFIVATHSPQIINDRWDLTNQLLDS